MDRRIQLHRGSSYQRHSNLLRRCGVYRDDFSREDGDMSTVGNPGHGATSVPDELVVDRPYENEVVARLADLSLDHDVRARSRDLDLSRVCVHGLADAAAT